MPGGVAEVSLNGEIVITTVAMFLTPFLILSRLYITRHHTKTRALMLSDITLVAFMVCLLTVGGIIYDDIRREENIRKTTSDLTEISARVNTTLYFKQFFASGLLYTTELWLLKASFLGYFFNIQRHFTLRSRIMFWFTVVFAVIGYLVVMGLQIGYCQPISRNWNIDPTQTCITLQTLPISSLQAMMNLTTDILVLILACDTIANLNLGRRERNALFFVAALGSVSIIMCVIRFAEVYQTIVNPAKSSLDVTRMLYMWGTLETNFALLAFCIPSYRSLFIRWFGHFHKSSGDSNPSRKIVTIGGSGAVSSRHGKRSRGMITVDDTIDITFHEREGSQTELTRLKPVWETTEAIA